MTTLLSTDFRDAGIAMLSGEVPLPCRPTPNHACRHLSGAREPIKTNREHPIQLDSEISAETEYQAGGSNLRRSGAGLSGKGTPINEPMARRTGISCSPA